MDFCAFVRASILIALVAQTLLGASACLADESQAQNDKDTPRLQSQEPSLDASKPAEEPPKPLLNGRIERADKLDLGASQSVGPPSDSANVMPTVPTMTIEAGQVEGLQNLMKAFGSPHVLHLIINGQESSIFNFGARRPKMSQDDFRRLEYGVIGLNCVVSLRGAQPIVTGTFPTCPAANAGIQKGDLLVEANGHTFQRGEGQRVLWRVVAGKAGTPVDVTVRRDGENITYHLIRMNIEDIQDKGIRRTYENLLEAIGPPPVDGAAPVTELEE